MCCPLPGCSSSLLVHLSHPMSALLHAEKVKHERHSQRARHDAQRNANGKVHPLAHLESELAGGVVLRQRDGAARLRWMPGKADPTLIPTRQASRGRLVPAAM